jgi:hypothetical protein
VTLVEKEGCLVLQQTVGPEPSSIGLVMPRQLAGDALEHAVLLAIKQQDDGAMERAFTQLKVFYTDTRSVTGCVEQYTASPASSAVPKG